MQDIEKWRAWKRKNPNFPLTVSPNGQWSKKIRKQTRYFGPLDNPDMALEIYLGERDFLLAGVPVPSKSQAGITIGELCDKFDEDVAGRGVADTYARDLRFATKLIRDHLVARRPVVAVTPEDFAKLRRVIAVSRRPRSQKNIIRHVRGAFLWGAEMGLHGPVQFGPSFKPPSVEAIERERESSGRVRFIDRQDILRLLHHARPAMQCMILLGINCGFYAQDSIRITFSRLHLDEPIPYHDFARVKTGRRRLAVLWPETVKRLRRYIADHRGPHPSDFVILNQYGRPYTGRATGRAIRTAFQNLLDTAGVTVSPGTSIGSLRHTYGTVVDLSADQQSIDLSMGHAAKGLQKRVYSQFNIGELDRLRVLAEVVRKWLFRNKLLGFNVDSSPAS